MIDIRTWYPWQVVRWRESDSCLAFTLAEQGAYRNLLDAQWVRDGYLPSDIELLWQLAKARSRQEFEPIWARIQGKFEAGADGRLFNAVLLAEFEAAMERREVLSAQRAAAGKRGGEASAKARQSSRSRDAEANASASGKQQPSSRLSKTKPRPTDRQTDRPTDRQTGGTPASPEAPPVTGVIRLPLNDGTEHEVSAAEVAEWGKLYPAVDVMQSLRNMRGWLLAHQARRKTRNGIAGFIQAWLARDQDRGGVQHGSGSREVSRKSSADERAERIDGKMRNALARVAGGADRELPAHDAGVQRV